MSDPDPGGADDIAIVGMAAHLPGAQDIAAYWENLKGGIRSIRRLSEQELLEAGESPARMRQPGYVPFAAPLDGLEMFDGDFFGFGPKESAILDPQHRRFLEVAWEALENAGHPPEGIDGPVGVFAGCGQGTYYWQNILTNPDLVDSVGHFLLRHTGNDKDFLTTRLSHVLDLTGPSLTIQTACSTSLVATHYAVQALLGGECDMALAGGVTIEMPALRGYIHKEGEILSPDGECHAFDHRAQGTVFGSGAGVVVLRRLADAQADGDHIWAVIKGSAVNNDGADKAGYLAPSVGGQAAAVAEAHGVAGITADTVDYVECHGTGTYLGDPIEVQALTDAFRETTDKTGFARIGSVKTNIGHLDTAAGVASLIKATLALHEGQMPPSLGYEAPNPAIDFVGSPFAVNDTLTPWPRRGHPRRAGVNSLGVGGTNAHVVLEEAPARAPSEPSDWPFQLLTISARSKAALDGNSARLARHLRAHPEQDLADVAWTLKEGRRAFERRRVVVAESHEEAAALLEEMDPRRVFTHEVLGKDPDVVFMFPGGGAQYAGMARDLYETEPVFRDWMDRGLAHLETLRGDDIRPVLWPDCEDDAQAAEERLRKPSVQLPLIMIVEYALAQLWMSWGVRPAALIGHSMGENTAACLAGVMSFQDCIGLVLLRGQLFDTVPAGGMLSVALPAEELTPYLGDDLDLASVNAPGLSVASGPDAALDALAARLEADGHDSTRVPIDIAAHSRMLEPILVRFGDYLRGIDLKPPQIPFISNRTGDWITEAEATDPDYWVRHLRGTVLFADGLTTLAEAPRVYLEVGPGKAMASLAQAHDRIIANQVIGSLRHPEDEIADDRYFMAQLGRMWAVGARIDWAQIWGEARRNRVVLPSYAFQQKPYYIAPGKAETAPAPLLERVEDVGGWGWAPVWRPRLAECLVDVTGDLAEAEPQTWLFFADEAGLAGHVAGRLRGAGHRVIEVATGDAFAALGDDRYRLSPERGREGFDRLIRTLVGQGVTPTRIAHFWLVTGDETHRPGSSFFHRNLEQGFFGLMFLAQAMAEENLPPVHIHAFTTGAQALKGEALPYPEKATIAGPIRVIPRELPGTSAAMTDLVLPDKLRGQARDLLGQRVLEELLAAPEAATAAIRGERRYVRDFVPRNLPEVEMGAIGEGARVLLTGGFGGIGLTLAEHLITTRKARIALLARSPLPPREDWAGWIADHGPHDATARRIAAVQRLEAAGGEVIVLGADVCNVEEMTEARARLESAWGGVDVVIHGAGVIDDGPLLTKSPASVEDVFTPKLHGTQVLERVFPDGELDLLVLFSSTSTITAPPGQVDYVAANEYLNAYARGRAGGKTRVIALDWGIWAEVGMAAEAVATRAGGGPRALPVPIDAPLLQTAGFDEEGHRIYEADLTTGAWVLGEHRTRAGDALLPGTGYLELAAEALRAEGEAGTFTIRDLYFLRPLDVADGAEKHLRLRLTRSDEGYELDVLSRAEVGGRKGWARHAQAILDLSPVAEARQADLSALTARLTPEGPQTGAIPAPQEAHLDFGPRWRVLRATALGAGEGLARLALPDQVRDADARYALHPALLDIATGWAMGLIEGYEGRHLWVPLSYGAVVVHGPLPAEIYSHVRVAGEASSAHPVASFDVTLMDGDGRVLVEIAGFSIKRLDDTRAFAKARPLTLTELEPDGAAGADAPRSPAEERLAAMLALGIRPPEGAAAFSRALAAGMPQVVISSIPLPALIAETDRSVVADAGGGQSFDRPDLDSDYVAPETDIERTLAGFWQDLLGVGDVGVEDSFFDLGGHSLIAVRLFAMVKRAWAVDFPISVLFEAPTIRKIAAQIEDRVGPQGAGAPAAAPAAPRRRWTHLVPMHEGEGGEKTPFFLVAGMFGNVLNLRHLAHLLGQDRPFYGVQARGLYGDDAPHDDLQEAARDYLAEIRRVQPHGPYMLGGFSGGGITAYEMARQLQAAGEEVSLLIMLDTPLPRRRPLKPIDRALIQWQELKARGPFYPLIWARNRLRWEIAKRRGRPVEERAEEGGFQDAAIEAAFYAAIARYDVQPWDGRVRLFRPPLRGKWQVSGGQWVNGERSYVLPDNDWSGHVADLEVFEVPGDHDSMVLEPNVRVLAARMKREIAAAEAEADPPAATRPTRAAE